MRQGVGVARSYIGTRARGRALTLRRTGGAGSSTQPAPSGGEGLRACGGALTSLAPSAGPPMVARAYAPGYPQRA
jgi:hypothetical protein